MISVIIPTYNRIDLLKKCIENLDAPVQSLSPGLYEIIITDDSNNNITKDYIKTNHPQVKWVRGPGKGPAANRNNGANHASGEWLVFIDDDCIPDHNLLKSYATAISNNPRTLAFEGAIVPDNWELLKKDMAECPVNTSGGCFWSANICVSKKLFDQINGFNEEFIIAAQEDQQLKIDIESYAHKEIVFLPNAVVIHPVRFSTLKKKIAQIPIASKNFCVFANNNKTVLGYTSLFKFMKSQVFQQLQSMYHSLKNKKLKQVAISIIYLFYLIPLNIINYQKLQRVQD